MLKSQHFKGKKLFKTNQLFPMLCRGKSSLTLGGIFTHYLLLSKDLKRVSKFYI